MKEKRTNIKLLTMPELHQNIRVTKILVHSRFTLPVHKLLLLQLIYHRAEMCKKFFLHAQHKLFEIAQPYITNKCINFYNIIRRYVLEVSHDRVYIFLPYPVTVSV